MQLNQIADEKGFCISNVLAINFSKLYRKQTRKPYQKNDFSPIIFKCWNLGMKHEDYQKVIKIFQSAIKLTPEKKAAFLKQECGEDVELRRKVEQLIDRKTANNRLNDPTINQVPEVVAEDEIEDEPTERSIHE